MNIYPSESLSQITKDYPWPGLGAYSEADATNFYGRDMESDTLLRMVQRESLTVVFGPSGVGKTSLLNAGLFPLLREKHFLPVRIRLVYSETPNLIEQIREAIVAAAQSGNITLEPLAEPLTTDAETLWEYLHRMEFWDQQNQPITPVLIFDQFEELFTLGGQLLEANRFISELADLVENNIPRTVQAQLAETRQKLPYASARPHYKIILSLREDFVARLDRLRGVMPLVMHNRLPLSAMNGEQAGEAVIGPGGHLVDEALAEQIVRFVAAEASQETSRPLADLAVEPAYLSVFCQELNLARIQHQQDRITLDLLDRNRDSILTDFYERSVADVSPSARIFIEEELLTASGYRDSKAVEDAQQQYGLSKEDLALLETRRLLRREERLKVPRIELVHDLLTGVVKASRDARRMEEARQKEALERQAMYERTRRLRRQRTLFGLLALVAVIAGLVAGWQWVEAEKAKNLANERKKAAEELVNFFTFDVHDALESYVPLEIRERVTRRVEAYFQRWGMNSTGETDRDYAVHLFSQGNIDMLNKNLAVAQQKFEEALKIFRKLSAMDPKNTGWRRDVTVSLDNVGDLLQAAGNRDSALAHYQESLAIRRELSAMDPKNTLWQRDLSIGFLKIGNVLLASGDYPAAAAFCQNAVGTLKANGENIPDHKSLLSDAQGCLCWSAVLTGNFSKAIEAGEEAVALLDHDKSCPARANLAHAYLLSNQFERARAIYQKYAGSTLEDGRKWNDEVRSDFQLLRKAGRDHPDMKKIEVLLQ
jgi:tetratricopeptide (TPR) repeat protein